MIVFITDIVAQKIAICRVFRTFRFGRNIEVQDGYTPIGEQTQESMKKAR
jgi:hypothetical protein